MTIIRNFIQTHPILLYFLTSMAPPILRHALSYPGFLHKIFVSLGLTSAMKTLLKSVTQNKTKSSKSRPPGQFPLDRTEMAGKKQFNRENLKLNWALSPGLSVFPVVETSQQNLKMAYWQRCHQRKIGFCDRWLWDPSLLWWSQPGLSPPSFEVCTENCKPTNHPLPVLKMEMCRQCWYALCGLTHHPRKGI